MFHINRLAPNEARTPRISAPKLELVVCLPLAMSGFESGQPETWRDGMTAVQLALMRLSEVDGEDVFGLSNSFTSLTSFFVFMILLFLNIVVPIS
jgi:hypothetical protein